jgi:fused signal recognition particle receptor
MGFFKQLFQKKKTLNYHKALEKGSFNLDTIKEAFLKHHTFNQDVMDAIETTLLTSDVGMMMTEVLIKDVLMTHKKNPITSYELLMDALALSMTSHIQVKSLNLSSPTVLLMVGVNGVGKTTTIGKLAHMYKDLNPLIIAADTFRAAAVDQLQIWADRVGVTCFKSSSKDPSSVIYDGMSYAKKHHHALVFIDTAGRLQAKDALMAELSKMYRVLSKFSDFFHMETLLVIDATTGQNGLSQAKAFKEVAEVSGVILTKLDGSAKGGTLIQITDTLQVPVMYVGLGETLEDLKPFDLEAYILSMLDKEDIAWN